MRKPKQDWVFYIQETESSRKKAVAIRIAIAHPERTKEAKQVRAMLDNDEATIVGYMTHKAWLKELNTINYKYA